MISVLRRSDRRIVTFEEGAEMANDYAGDSLADKENVQNFANVVLSTTPIRRGSRKRGRKLLLLTPISAKRKTQRMRLRWLRQGLWGHINPSCNRARTGFLVGIAHSVTNVLFFLWPSLASTWGCAWWIKYIGEEPQATAHRTFTIAYLLFFTQPCQEEYLRYYCPFVYARGPTLVLVEHHVEILWVHPIQKHSSRFRAILSLPVP